MPLGLLAVWLLFDHVPQCDHDRLVVQAAYFIALAIFGILATFSQIAAACAAVLTLGVRPAFACGFPGVGVIAGQGFAVLATLSSVGWGLRMLVWRTRSKAQLLQHPST